MGYKFTSVSLDDTYSFGEKLGSKLKGGEVLQLIGDVGAGKTTFVRGLVKGAGSKDHVSSPTFAICNIYQGSAFKIYHCDFYRLHDDTLIEKELEELIDGRSLVVLEWAEQLAVIKQMHQITVAVKAQADDSRRFDVNFPEEYSYVL